MEYTYDNWVDNKFEYSSYIEQLIPKIELNKIRRHQRKIFDSLWQKELDNYIDKFEWHYENASEKEDCFKTEWSYIITLLNSDKKLLSGYISNVLPPHIPNEDIDAIREIVSNEIKSGNINLANIKSPYRVDDDSIRGYIDRGHNLRNQLQARAFYHFYKFLENFKKENFKEIKTTRISESIPILNMKYKDQLKKFYALLIEYKCIDNISYELFQKHMAGDSVDQMINWKLSVNDLIFLLDEVSKDFYSIPAVNSNREIRPQLISNHFSYLTGKNINPNYISKLRLNSKIPKKKHLLQKISISLSKP